MTSLVSRGREPDVKAADTPPALMPACLIQVVMDTIIVVINDVLLWQAFLELEEEDTELGCLLLIVTG